MNRIPIDRILALSDSKRDKVKPVKNALVDFYLDGFKRRERNKQKQYITIVNYLTLLAYIISIVKYLSYFFPSTKRTKLILFDLSLLFGGIEIYNRIYMFFALILGLVMNIELRLSTKKTTREWSQVFEMTRSRVTQVFVRAKLENDILMKMIKITSLIYKVMNMIVGFLGKSIKNFEMFKV